MSTFIGYTIGLNCNGHGMTGKLLQAEFNRLDDGRIKLTAVSARNGAALNFSTVVSAEQYENRPDRRLDNVDEARWAMGLLGFTLAGDRRRDPYADAGF